MATAARQNVPRKRALAAPAAPAVASAVLAIFGTQDPGAIHRAIDHATIHGTAISQLRELLTVARRELAPAFAMAERTLTRLEGSRKPLSVEDADRVYRVSRIADLATRMIGDPEKAHRWLRIPVPALGGARPLDMVKTDAGAREVERVLHAIGYGGVA
jgi:putative toxin-antitoxin system antitoxin component (TIGR02293 family)